jgi:hypothetical protein
MAYDPSKPVNGAPIVSAELRSQFAGLQENLTGGDANLQQQLDGLLGSDAFQDAVDARTAGPVTGIATLSLSVSNPPTQAQVQAVANKLDELITALQRL